MLKPLRTWCIILGLAAAAWCPGAILAQATKPAPAPPPNAPAPADAPPSTAPNALPTVEQLDARLKAALGSPDLDDTAKKAIESAYERAKERLADNQRFVEQSAQYRRAVETAATDAKAIRETLARTPLEPSAAAALKLAPDADTAAIEQQLKEQQSALNDLSAAATTLDEAIKTQVTRPDAARKELAGAKSVLDEIETSLKTPAPAGENPKVTEAKQLALRVRKASRLSEINMLEQELLSHEGRLDLLKAQREQLQRRVTSAAAQVKALEALLNQRRRDEADRARQAAETARREASDKHPVVQKLAGGNADLGAKLSELTAQIADSTTQRQTLAERIKQFDADVADAKAKLERAGMSNVVGQLLRRQRVQLPEPRVYEREAARRQERLARATNDQIVYEEQIKELDDLDAAVASAMGSAADVKSPDERRAIEAEVRALLLKQQELLKQVDETIDLYRRKLTDLDVDQSAYYAKVKEYAEFLDERLLWIPSGEPWGTATLRGLGTGVAWLLDPRSWVQTGKDLLHAAAAMPLPAALVLVIFAALIVLRRHLWRKLDDVAGRVGRVQTDKFLFTVQALAITFIQALPVPLVVGGAGWLLLNAVDASDFSKAVGFALFRVALLLLMLRFPLLLCRSKGVAEMHFRWRPEAVASLRANLRLLLMAEVPCAFIVASTRSQPNDAITHGLGMAAFVAASVVLAMFAARVLRLGGDVLGAAVREHRGGWLWRLRYAWYPTAVAAPMAMIVAAALGYYLSAVRLQGRLFYTGFMIGGAVLVHEMLLRWLFVAHRRLALEKAREKRQAALAAQAAKEEGDGSPRELAAAIEIPEVDLDAISIQTRHLLNTVIGFSTLILLWLVWADVLPALNVLNDVRLWARADGGLDDATHWVTLADAAIAVVLAATTVVAARNLPGVLEIGLLQRLPIDAGARYATTSICRYVITGIGIFAAFKVMGFAWSQIQWLVAALSVGLGFGLQEIVANFVSGLIILFERPIRVGDIVTVGDTTGVVSRIRIRATTVTDWDRKELIVPNKEFITGRLLNWTLTNPVNRVVLNVGVAYGSDTEKARSVLRRVIDEHPIVMKDPVPIVTFEGFGDSTLNLVARCYLPNLDNRLQVITDLHTAIDKAFRAEGIEIAFPQRDLHIRSIEPILQVADRRQTERQADWHPGG